MIKQLTKLSKLHKTDIRNIKNLVDRCANHDGFKIKLYWHIIENRLTMEFNDFFYYLDGNLIGYLAIFTFDNNEAEMTALVHPRFRHKGLFKKLLAEATLELKQRHMTHCVWICPKNSHIDKRYVQVLDGEYIFSQVEMIAAQEPVQKALPDIQLRQAHSSDLTLLAKIGAISFNSSFTETLQRFMENLKEKNRKIWLASTKEHENVGKIHVRYEDNKTAFIHDLCILPEYRGRNLAMAMILKTMKLLRDSGQRTILLDVECHNEGALRLYEQCGFIPKNSYDFWRIPIKKMEAVI